MRAALGADRDFAQALRARLGGGRRDDLGPKSVQQSVDRQDNQEVNGRSDDQKRDQGIEKVAVLDDAAMDIQQQEGESPAC